MKTLHNFLLAVAATLFVSCGGSAENPSGDVPEEGGKNYKIELPGYEGTFVCPDSVNIRALTIKDTSGKVEKFPLIDVQGYTLLITRTSGNIDSVKSEIKKSPFDKFKKFLFEGDNCFVAEASAFMDDVEMVYIAAVVIPAGNVNYLIQPYGEMDDKQMAHILMEVAQGYKPVKETTIP
ncbi:MAG: hypothetical protein ACHQF2_11675 [Flavobacteriales bacterium]